MRVFSCPAAYSRFITAEIALKLAEVKRDMDRRSDEDPRVRALATVPDPFIDPTARGTLIMLVGDGSVESITALVELASCSTAIDLLRLEGSGGPIRAEGEEDRRIAKSRRHAG